VADGGRVHGVTARDRTIIEAKARVYAANEKIDRPGGVIRRDIGWRAAARSS
jgi:phosphoribosylamine--glycine ligase